MNSSKLFKSKEFKIGLVTVACLIGIYILITFLKGKDFIKGTRTYYALYENVEGLTESCPVNIAGMKAGIVDRITFNEDRKDVTVRMRLDKDFSIPLYSEAQIYSTGLLGGKAVRILFSDEDRYHAGGDTLSAKIEKDVLSAFLEEMLPVREEISQMLAELTGALSKVNALLDTANREQFSSALTGLNKSMDNIETATAVLRDGASHMGSLLSNADSLVACLNDSRDNIGKTMEGLSAFADNLKSADVKAAVDELKALTAQIRNPQGSIGKLMYSDSTEQNINRLLSRIDTLVKNISENPKKYIRIKVF